MTRTKTLPDKNRERAQKPEFLVRGLSAIVLAVLALAATIASAWTFLLLAILAGAILAWEWGKLVRGTGFDAIAWIQAIGVAAVVILIALRRPEIALAALAIGLVAIGLASFATNRLWWSLAGLLYTALTVGALVWLRSDQTYGATVVLYVFVVAWTTDTVSYAAGRSIGGAKLSPHISPNKTWSGFIAGALAPAIVGYAFALVLGATTAWRLALVSVALALACQMGDLVESAVKRRFGVKDMSELIPGHGGLFDRIDGLLLAGLLAGLIALRDAANPGQGLLIW